jgi:hypothetical protein
MRAVARTLRVDAAAAEVLRGLREADCRAILVRGASLERELHEPGRRRTYGDTDVLVQRADLRRAGGVLSGLGYDLVLDHRDHPGVAEPHAQEWTRSPHHDRVDLHWRLPGVNAPPEVAWQAFSVQTVPIHLGGATGETLNRAGVALLVALHAGHHGDLEQRPLRDLDRALEALDRDTGSAASRLAAQLDAGEAFAAGLRLDPAGAELAAELRLPEVASSRRRLMAAGAPPGSLGLLSIVEAPTLRRRVAAFPLRLFPRPDLMRRMSPLARRGRAGLALAYPARLGSRAWRLPAAIRAVRASRRPPPGSRPPSP